MVRPVLLLILLFLILVFILLFAEPPHQEIWKVVLAAIIMAGFLLTYFRRRSRWDRPTAHMAAMGGGLVLVLIFAAILRRLIVEAPAEFHQGIDSIMAWILMLFFSVILFLVSGLLLTYFGWRPRWGRPARGFTIEPRSETGNKQLARSTASAYGQAYEVLARSANSVSAMRSGLREALNTLLPLPGQDHLPDVIMHIDEFSDVQIQELHRKWSEDSRRAELLFKDLSAKL